MTSRGKFALWTSITLRDVLAGQNVPRQVREKMFAVRMEFLTKAPANWIEQLAFWEQGISRFITMEVASQVGASYLYFYNNLLSLQ